VNERFNFKSLLFLAYTEESVARKGHDVVEFWKNVDGAEYIKELDDNKSRFAFTQAYQKVFIMYYATCEASFLWMK